jgi:aminocarboxymuconate-semialdehyde decarboxylase
MITIDTHTHIIPEEIPDWSAKFGYGEFIRLHHHEKGKAWMIQGGKKFREIEENCWSPEKRVEDMHNHKIDVQVICTIPVMFSYWAKKEHTLEVAKFLNDHIIKTCKKYPKKFIGLGTIPLQDERLSIDELQRCMESGMKGVQIGSNVNNKNLNEPEFAEFFAAAESLNAAILIHPWQMMGQEHMSRYWLPWLVGMPAEISRAICSMIFGGIFEKHPNLKVAFAHGGGSFLPTLGRIIHGWECRPDLVAIDNPHNPKKYLGKFWVDSHTCDHKMLQYVIDMIGSKKIMQGSDYPFPLGEAVAGELVRSAPISEEDKNNILCNSVLEWLGTEEKLYKD